jgi:hypothetical protein
MRSGFTLQLTFKNLAGFVAGASVAGLAAIAVLVAAERLQNWRLLIVVLSIMAFAGLVTQMILQSQEDTKRDERDKKLEEFLDKNRPAKIAPALEPPSPPSSSAGFYIELRSTFIYPKVGDLPFQLLEGKYKASGRNPDEVTTDCDVLVDLYVVNKSDKSLYIKDFSAWLEIESQWCKLKLDDNFHVDDLWAGSVEYGLEQPQKGEFGQEPSELLSLLSRKNAEIRPQEPVEGWLKFTAADINPRRKYSIRVAIIDSIGREHHIDKSELKDRNIGLRRVRH